MTRCHDKGAWSFPFLLDLFIFYAVWLEKDASVKDYEVPKDNSITLERFLTNK